MGRTALKYGAGLIALYLVVFYGTKSGGVIKEAAAGTRGVVKSLQGR